MKKAAEVQRRYYTQTAASYEDRHVYSDDEHHHIALKYSHRLY